MKKQKRKKTRFCNESLLVMCILLFALAASLLSFACSVIRVQSENAVTLAQGEVQMEEEGMGSSVEREEEEETNLEEEQPLEEVIKERIPLLYQWDERWGSKLYGAGEMATTGCGPTCLSMVAMYLLQDTSLTPDWMADFSMNNGYCVAGSGTSWTFMSEGAQMLGIEAREIAPDEWVIQEALEANTPIICIMGPGDFTDGGHFIVLSGWEDGKIRINDPNSTANSEKLWTYEEIKGQIRNMWEYYIG